MLLQLREQTLRQPEVDRFGVGLFLRPGEMIEGIDILRQFDLVTKANPLLVAKANGHDLDAGIIAEDFHQVTPKHSPSPRHGNPFPLFLLPTDFPLPADFLLPTVFHLL